MSGAIIVLLRGGAAAPVTTHSYQWQSSPDQVTWTNIAAATSATLVLTSALSGLYVSCLDTATDDGGSTTQRSNVLGPLAPAGKVNLGLTTADLTPGRLVVIDQHTVIATLTTTNAKPQLANAATVDVPRAAVTTSDHRV